MATPEEIRNRFANLEVSSKARDVDTKSLIVQMAKYNTDMLEAVTTGMGGPRPAPKPNAKLRVFSSGDPEEWFIFRRHVEMVQKINTWGDERACQELQNALDGAAARRVEELSLAGKTLAQALAIYEGRFVHSADSQLARTAFNSCRQKENEGVLDWHGRCRALHVRAWRLRNDRETAEDLIHRFAHGLHNPGLFMKVMEHNPTTYTAALIAGQNAEAVHHSLRARNDDRKGNYSISAMSSASMMASLEDDFPGTAAMRPKTGRFESRMKQAGAGGSRDKACWCCGSNTHLRSECRKYKSQMNGLGQTQMRRTPGRGAARGRGATRGSRPSWRGSSWRGARRSPRQLGALDRQLAVIGYQYEDDEEDWEAECAAERAAAGN
jgi:hypothetical protein